MTVREVRRCRLAERREAVRKQSKRRLGPGRGTTVTHKPTPGFGDFRRQAWQVDSCSSLVQRVGSYLGWYENGAGFGDAGQVVSGRTWLQRVEAGAEAAQLAVGRLNNEFDTRHDFGQGYLNVVFGVIPAGKLSEQQQFEAQICMDDITERRIPKAAMLNELSKRAWDIIESAIQHVRAGRAELSMESVPSNANDTIQAGAGKGGCQAASEPVGDDPPEFEFRKSGSNYKVRFDGEEGDVPASLLGAQYVYRLLQQPNKPVSAVELRGDTPTGVRNWQNDEDETHDTIKRYEERLKELASDIEEAKGSGNMAEQEQLTSERDSIIAHIAKLPGLGGRARSTEDDLGEKARQSVRRAIVAFSKKCREKYGLPKFASHMKDWIETGFNVCYCPPVPGQDLPTWEFLKKLPL